MHLGIVAMLTQIKPPLARMDHKHLSRVMAVLRVDTARRLARAANVEAVRIGNVDMLFGVFGNSGADNREIFFCLRTR